MNPPVTTFSATALKWRVCPGKNEQQCLV